MRKLRMLGLAALALVAVDSALLGDVVYLKSGQRIEGTVTRNEEKGTVKIKKSSNLVVEIPLSDIARIEARKAPREEFEERFAEVEDGDLDALVSLAVWAREKSLKNEVRQACRKILAIDPNHEMARRELGYVVFENVWVLESELRKNQKEQGLVKHLGEWMTEEERDRRLRDEARRQIADLMESVLSKNRYVQEFAVRKLMARQGEHDPEIFASYLDHEDEMVRIVAASALANSREKNPPEKGPEAARITEKIFGRLMRAESKAELEALHLALRLFQPEESFRRALEALRTSGEDRALERAAEVAYQTLRKDWVPDLCRAVAVERDGRRVGIPVVRDLLERVLKVDHGYDVERWLEWWEAHQGGFYDEP